MGPCGVQFVGGKLWAKHNMPRAEAHFTAQIIAFVEAPFSFLKGCQQFVFHQDVWRRESEVQC